MASNTDLEINRWELECPFSYKLNNSLPNFFFFFASCLEPLDSASSKILSAKGRNNVNKGQKMIFENENCDSYPCIWDLSLL